MEKEDDKQNKQDENLKPYDLEKLDLSHLSDEERDDLLRQPDIVYSVPDFEDSKQYTYADYLTWADEMRCELINGIIYLMTGPRSFHQKISLVLSSEISNFLKKYKGPCQVFYAPFDVRLPMNGETRYDKIKTVVQPDIIVVCDPSKIDDWGCFGAPDMVVEILSPSTRKLDLSTKFLVYEKVGVKEYWVIDPKNQTVQVFILHAERFFEDPVVYEKDMTVPVKTLPGLEIQLSDVFDFPKTYYNN